MFEELAAKRFSAASTDKLLLDAKAHGAAMSSDAVVVKGIMEEFVSHLGTNWDVEAICLERFYIWNVQNQANMNIFRFQHL